MRILVTGALGGVGSRAAARLEELGHDVTRTDRRPQPDHGEPGFLVADLSDGAQAALVVGGHEAVVHCAGIPDATRNPGAVVFENNVLTTLNVASAAHLSGVSRLVYISSETVLGYHYSPKPSWPLRLPLDESAPTAPLDFYGLSKLVGEQVVAVAAADGRLSAVSLRPSWVQYPQTYVRDLETYASRRTPASSNLWSYTDGDDLADAIALAVDAPIEGHEVMFVVNSDNVGDHDLVDLVRHHYGVDIEFADGASRYASAIDSSKAMRLLGWQPRRSWRDYVGPSA